MKRKTSESSANDEGIGAGTNKLWFGRVLPWVIGGAALWVIALLMLTQHILFGGPSANFEARREALNNSLRESLNSLGIDARERRIEENWERLSDADSSWEAVNWRIRIQRDFDIQSARHRLLTAIRGAGATPFVKLNPEDREIPMIVEASISGRLSHRLYFIAAAPSYSPRLSVNAEAFLGSRWGRLSGDARKLDHSLYNALSALDLNGPPLLIREFYQPVEGVETVGETVFHWVISNSAGKNTAGITEQLRRLIPDAEVFLSSAANGPGDEMSTLDVSLAGRLSHRIILTHFPDGRGIRLRKIGQENIVLFAPPRVALIIDDIGLDEEIADKFMRLGIPVTLSIIPYLPFSRSIAERAHLRGLEIMLHLPMEPEGYPETDPGKGAILVSLSAGAIRSRTAEDIDAVPHISGVNNHMGSLAMSNSQIVQEVLEVIKKRELFFVDSRTSAQTLGFAVARRLNLPSAERAVFIDSVENTDTAYRVDKLRELILRAKQRGTAVGIGHPSPETLEAIRRVAEEFRREGIEIVYASEVVS